MHFLWSGFVVSYNIAHLSNLHFSNHPLSLSLFLWEIRVISIPQESNTCQPCEASLRWAQSAKCFPCAMNVCGCHHSSWYMCSLLSFSLAWSLPPSGSSIPLSKIHQRGSVGVKYRIEASGAPEQYRTQIYCHRSCVTLQNRSRSCRNIGSPDVWPYFIFPFRTQAGQLPIALCSRRHRVTTRLHATRTSSPLGAPLHTAKQHNEREWNRDARRQNFKAMLWLTWWRDVRLC